MRNESALLLLPLSLFTVTAAKQTYGTDPLSYQEAIRDRGLHESPGYIITYWQFLRYFIGKIALFCFCWGFYKLYKRGVFCKMFGPCLLVIGNFLMPARFCRRRRNKRMLKNIKDHVIVHPINVKCRYEYAMIYARRVVIDIEAHIPPRIVYAPNVLPDDFDPWDTTRDPDCYKLIAPRH